MKKRFLIPVFAVLLGAAAYCYVTKKTDREFLSHTRSAIWAKTGDILYYYDDDNRLWLYNLLSGKREMFGKFEIEDVSPDRRLCVTSVIREVKKQPRGKTWRSYAVVRDIKTGKKTDVYESNTFSGLSPIRWLDNKRIALSEGKEGGRIIIVDCNSRRAQVIVRGVVMDAVSIDGRGLVYTDGGRRSYYYDLASRKKKMLPRDVAWSLCFPYLSSKQLVYQDELVLVSLDLRSMTVHKLGWQERSLYQGISPSLSRVWTATVPRGEYGREELHVGPVPPGALKIMKKIEGRN